MSEKAVKSKKESWWSPRKIFKDTLMGVAGTIAFGWMGKVVSSIFAAGSPVGGKHIL